MADPAPIVQININHEFVSPVVDLGTSGSLVPVARIQAMGRPVLLQGIVTGSALAHLKITQAAVRDGVHESLASDADFNNENVANPYTLSIENGTSQPTPYLTAAGGTFQIRLESGAAEYAVYAGSNGTDTQLQVQGSCYPWPAR
jgi:hypothetical protein